MKKFYEKSEIWFAVVWIIAYCVLVSVGDDLSTLVGIANVITAPITVLLSVLLFVFVKKNSLMEKYGLCRSEIPASKMLFYIPVLMMMSVHFWYGAVINLSVLETVLHILKMLGVGFLEELIFRGLLFKAMLKDGTKSAIIVSSVTFGIGHIINLFNGSGAELLPNILQVIYATAIGFMFVMMFYKTKSLIVCIAAHGIFNSLSAFANKAAATDMRSIMSCLFLVVVCGGYALYIALRFRKAEKV